MMFIKKLLRNRLGSLWLIRYARLILNYKLYIKSNLSSQLRPLKLTHPCTGRRYRILVPLIETSHYQFYQVLVLAKALELRGAHIKLLLCGSRLNGCELKSVRSSKIDPCLSCRFNQERVVPFFKFDTSVLSDYVSDAHVTDIRCRAQALSLNYPTSFEYKGVDIIPMTTDSVVRYFYGATPKENSSVLREVRNCHLESSMIGIDAAEAIFQEWKPDSILGNMNVYSAWEPYTRFFSERSVKTNIVSMSTFNQNAVVINRMELYQHKHRYERWLALRRGSPLTYKERLHLSQFMKQRFDGTAAIFKKLDAYLTSDSAISSLYINPDKRNVFLFSNLYWDVGLTESATIYNGVIPWVLDTIDILKNQPDCHLYIKPHPAEVFDTSISIRGIVDYIHNTFPCLPSNVSIIEPELRIKPYDLFPMIDLGILYNGTIGLEMMQMDIPIVVAGASPYGHLNSVSSPRFRDEYAKILKGELELPGLLRQEVELFSYFYFIKTLIPWSLTNRVYDDDFRGYSFESLEDLLPGKNPYLDHLCNCILDPSNMVVEGWS